MMSDIDQEQFVLETIEHTRWRAAHAQRWMTISAWLASVSLFVAIAFERPTLFASAALFYWLSRDHRNQRNHELRRLHWLGANRWMGAPAEEFGRALR